MSDDASPLPWTPQQWASLRAVVQESARKSRVASTFLPLSGPVPKDQSTVPANWIEIPSTGEYRQRGEAEQRLEVTSGITLQLTTISTRVYLRGPEVADPELEAAKSMLRRAAEVLARLEDAIIFNGIPKEGDGPEVLRDDGTPVVQPPIYTITGGRNLTGLRDAPMTLLATGSEKDRTDFRAAKKAFRDARHDLHRRKTRDAAGAKTLTDAKDALTRATASLRSAESQLVAARAHDFMSVSVHGSSEDSPIVTAVINAVEKLEQRGHFGPFAAAFGHKLFADATRPAKNSLVLPSDRFVPFLDGGSLYRSSTLPDDEGVVVALGGSPIELVLGTDMDVQFLQVTLEPRYVLRVYERFVLRIKELDAVCRIVLPPKASGVKDGAPYGSAPEAGASKDGS